MFKKNKKLNKIKGFSLIELLIVITIIGILSTIILSSLSNSRAKAYDTKIKQQLSSFRTAAEVYFGNQNPPSYGPATNSCNSGIFNDVDPQNSSPGIFLDPANLPTFSSIVCMSTDTAYAVKVSLYSGNDYWCVDNKGAFRLVNGPIGGPVTICP